MTAMMVFQNQLEAAESATPRERMEIGKFSPTTTGTPGGSEKKDVDTDEGDLGIDGGNIICDWTTINCVGVVETDGVTDDGYHKLADEHSEGTPVEKRATTELLDCPERYGGRKNVDERENKGNEEGVADSVRRLEEGCRVVEDEVDPSPLLHHLERCSENSTTKVALGFP